MLDDAENGTIDIPTEPVPEMSCVKALAAAKLGVYAVLVWGWQLVVQKCSFQSSPLATSIINMPFESYLRRSLVWAIGQATKCLRGVLGTRPCPGSGAFRTRSRYGHQHWCWQGQLWIRVRRARTQSMMRGAKSVLTSLPSMGMATWMMPTLLALSCQVSVIGRDRNSIISSTKI